MFLSCEHEDDKDELGGQEHFDEAALRDGGLACEGCVYVEGAGEEGGDYARGTDACDPLGEEDVHCAQGTDSADEVEAERHLRPYVSIELSTRGFGDVLTAGLNNPPLIRKKAHTFTAKLNPNARLIYSRLLEFGNCESVLFSVGGAAALATWVAAKAMKRNMNVPANSPRKAIISLRAALGRKERRLRRRSFRGLLGLVEVVSRFVKGRTGFLKETIVDGEEAVLLDYEIVSKEGGREAVLLCNRDSGVIEVAVIAVRYLGLSYTTLSRLSNKKEESCKKIRKMMKTANRGEEQLEIIKMNGSQW